MASISPVWVRSQDGTLHNLQYARSIKMEAATAENPAASILMETDEKQSPDSHGGRENKVVVLFQGRSVEYMRMVYEKLARLLGVVEVDFKL